MSNRERSGLELGGKVENCPPTPPPPFFARPGEVVIAGAINEKRKLRGGFQYMGEQENREQMVKKLFSGLGFRSQQINLVGK